MSVLFEYISLSMKFEPQFMTITGAKNESC